MEKEKKEKANIWILKDSSRLYVKTWDKGRIAIDSLEIVCVTKNDETGGSTVLIKKESSEEFCYDFEASLTEFEALLPANRFVRINGRELLNLAMVDKIISPDFYVGKHCFTVGKKYYEEVLSHFVIDGLNDQAIQFDKLVVPDSIFVWEHQQYVKVEFSHIKLIHADGNYTNIMLDNRRNPICTVCSLAKWEARLVSLPFMKVHRSYIINILQVTGVASRRLYIDNHVIPIPETKQREIKQFFHIMKRENKK